VNQRSYTIETVCDLELRETDFTDDRLGILLRRLSHDHSWKDIETDLNRHSIRVYQLGVTRVRIDATTNSGYHLVTEEGLFQFGHSKDNPNLPQLKTMMASLDPLGMPLVTKVVSGRSKKIRYQPWNPADNCLNRKITHEGWYLISRQNPQGRKRTMDSMYQH
jgi:transposase